MPRIEDYALIGDLQTAALVGRDGSIDWCCFPRFDSGACFAAILGTPEDGRWLLAPTAETVRSSRRYRQDTLILESIHEIAGGSVRVIDFMPPRGHAPDIVRIVEGLSGEVAMRSELVVRYDFGRIVPWVRRLDDARSAVAGPDALCFRTPAETRGEELKTLSEFTVSPGERVPFVLTWFPSHEQLPDRVDPEQALADTEDYWLSWAMMCEHEGDYHHEIHQSLLVLEALYQTRAHGAPPDEEAWSLTTKLLDWLELHWHAADAGIWEIRGPLRHFTHSKLMAWVAFDRAVRFHDEFGREGPVERWRAVREQIRAAVFKYAWSEQQQAFAQSFGSDQLDASVLLMPLVGFLPATDERFVLTVAAIRRELTVDGLVLRYKPQAVGVDGLPGGEGVFLPCSFWLAAVLALQGSYDEARELFERLLDLRNDVGLLSEEYDPLARRQLGNFPQAFTHLALIETAFILSEGRPHR